MLERQGKRIIVVESHRNDELFGGLIGKVNATEKDGKELAKYISSQVYLGENSAEITPTKYGFGVLILTEYKGKPYSIQIDEEGSKKIVVSLSQGSRELGSTSGLRLDKAKIYKAIRDLLKKENINVFDLKKPKSSTRSTVSTWDSGQKKQADDLNEKWKRFEKEWSWFLHELKNNSMSYAKYREVEKKVNNSKSDFWSAYRDKGMDPKDYYKKNFGSSSSRSFDRGYTFDDYYASTH